jgi:hypothetical protein
LVNQITIICRYLPSDENTEYNLKKEGEGFVRLEYIGACDISYSKKDSQKA